MESELRIIDLKHLKETYKRLKKSTKGFNTLIVRDVLDFIDFEIEVDKYLNKIVFDINQGKYIPQKPYLIESPKSKGINRPTVVLSIEDALVYRYCIEQIEDILISKTRQKNVHGGIKISAIQNPSGNKEFYEKWFKDWHEYNLSLEKGLEFKEYAVFTDIASYFENINLLVLKDLVRSDVKGKNEILNLLFYFLENSLIRYRYKVNTYNGLLQENIDCSRILAYYFLHEHDDRMSEFCKEKSAEFYRFVDDMTILVDSEVDGKKALKVLTGSLRKLGLLSSIEKTSILTSGEANEELFFRENKEISDFEQETINKLSKKETIDGLIRITFKYYKTLRKKKSDKKNWVKILKRFYTIFTYAKSNVLFPELIKHLIAYPILVSNEKILKYLITNQKSKNFNKILHDIIDYLYSNENLYPSLESDLLEYFLAFENRNLSDDLKEKLRKLCNDVFFKSNNFKPLSEYSRAIACLLFYKYDHTNIKKLANHYVKSNENDGILKKHLIFVSLTVVNQRLRINVLNKAKKEQDYSINRLINFIEGLPRYSKNILVKRYCEKNEKFIYYKKGDEFKITETFDHIRGKILKDLIRIYK